MLILYQAEWCPYSSAARQLLTEVGLPFVARQVAPEPEARDELRERAGTDEIPVLETDDGRFFRGTDEILGYLATLEPWGHADAHRRQYADHAGARRSEVTAGLLERVPRPGV